jgi:hypothetical protein
MFSKYFEIVQNKILKSLSAKKVGGGKGLKSQAGSSIHGLEELKDLLNNIIPSNLKADSLRIVDPSGYSPDASDLIAYRELFRDIDKIMDGCIPSDLIYGTFHLCNDLNQNNFADVLSKVVAVKKINRFTEEAKETSIIPAFIIAYGSTISLQEIKEQLLNYYISKSIEQVLEVDIIAVLNFGVIVKDWREKRNFVALETGKDTLKWFFVLINEYMDVNRGGDIDLRNYIQNAEKYKEY